MSGPAKESACYLVAADAVYRYGDSPPICDGAGAFLYELDDAMLAENLIELYNADCPNRVFDLAIVQASGLSPHQIVLARREIRRGESIGINLDSHAHGTSDPVLAALGRCVITLGRLEGELQHVLQDSAKAKVSEPDGDAYSVSHRLFPPVAKPQTLLEALDRLTYVLERHRLVFLHFAAAVRRNPSTSGGSASIYERVRHEEILGHKQYLEQVDSDGEFLFTNKWFLDLYADEAISRFGPGEGAKPNVEGASHPYWSLDEMGASYLQESADLIHSCVGWLRTLDTRSECDELVTSCLGIAYDQGKSRWYSSIVTRWKYLSELDESIAAVKRTAVLLHRPGRTHAAESAPDDAWFYLRVAYDEAMFNHDPELLGCVVGDPNYYPLDSGMLTFFKVRGEVLAERLIRLFDRAVKPNVEREGETRVRVSFSSQRVDAFDKDDILLIEEEIASARTAAERLDQEWKSQNKSTVASSGGVSEQRRPLSGEPLSYQRLYDQARRWAEKLVGDEPTSSNDNEPTSIEPASEDILRVALPTAVMAAAGLRDLIRVRVFYPGVIPDDEANALHEGFAANLKSAAEICKLDRILEITRIPTPDEIGSDAGISAVMGLLVSHHPDVTVETSSRDAMAKQLDAAMTKCQQDLTGPLRSMLERVQQAMLFDCRVPCPKGDDSFQEPQRFLQMLRAYWTVIRQLVLHHIEAPIGYRPHPLLPLVVNLKARIDECFSRLNHLENAADVHQQITSLVDIVLSEEPDDLSVVPEWSYDEVGGIDRFIEEARLALGAKSYPLTPAEEMCLEQAQKAVAEYARRVREGWAKMCRHMDAARARSAGQPAPSTEASDSEPQQATAEQPLPKEPTTFRGGELVFLPDRVTICGADICSGPRCGTRRRILDLLKTQNDGKFIALSSEEIAKAAQVSNGAKAVPGAIRALREDIVESLRARNISSGRFDVIVNDRCGYHFAECISIQNKVESDETVITDMDCEGHVRNVRDGELDHVRNVPDDPSLVRKEWILRRLEEGHQLKGPDVARKFACSDKTAQRDLAALKDEGTIEFVGAPRTGYYRLCQDRDPNTDE